MGKFLKLVAALLTGAFMTVAAGEITLRMFYFGPDSLLHWARYEPLDSRAPYFLVLSENDRIGVEVRPNHQWYFLGKLRKSNALGVVDSHSEADLKAYPTMVVMGESYAEGAGVEMDERFTAVLEKKMRENKPVNVVNMAITNASLNGQIELLKEKIVPAYSPKVVVVSFLAQINYGSKAGMKDLWRERVKVATNLFPLWKRKFMLFILHDYLTALQSKGRALVSKAVQKGAALPPGIQTDLSEADALFEELAALSAKHGFKVVLCPLSHMKDLQNPDRNGPERDYLESVAGNRGFYYIDAFKVFDGLDVKACILWASNRHMNAYAHRLLGEAIYGEFIRQNILS